MYANDNMMTRYMVVLHYYTYNSAGFEDCTCTYDADDLQFCKQYTTTKPAPAGIEFLQLVEIIMEEEDWPMPSNYEEALDLYINLLNEME